jgi:hypothetical protein
MSSQVKAIKAYYFIINRVVNDFRLSTFKVDSRKVGEYFEVEKWTSRPEKVGKAGFQHNVFLLQF